MRTLIAAALVAALAGCATPRRTVYYVPENRGYVSGPGYVVPAQTTQQDVNRKVLMQGVTGAAVGAIAAEASGGKAGTGALVGAGTNVLGSALVDVLSTPSAPQPQYVTANQGYVNQPQPYQQRKILRKFDSQGNVISEEEILD